MEVIGEALLSPVLDFLFGQLASVDLLKFASEEGVDTELKNWRKELVGIQEKLSDAEERQITDGKVKSWLVDLRALVYDMEDVIDEFAYHVMRRKLTGEPGTSKNRKLSKFIPTCCTNFKPTHTVRLLNMGPKIQGISARLHSISDTKGNLVLEDAIKKAAPARPTLIPTTDMACGQVYGRDEDKRLILNMLRKVEARDNNFGVISIVGPGGVGKTTLARLVYNDVEVAENFEQKAWACVSDVFDLGNIIKSILNSVKGSDAGSSLDFQTVQHKLRDELENKKFLLVLDDVWPHSDRHWDCLQTPLSAMAKGSKVIVTTRDKTVALNMGPSENLHPLLPLSEDACWSVFQKQALEFRNEVDRRELEPIGREIVVKYCRGSPLATKALGGLLRTKCTPEEWKGVFNSKLWELSRVKSEIFPVLFLSYHQLPSHLKRCFAYCAIFPQDYEFEPKRLVLLWMAEGLIKEPNSTYQTMEDLGDQYFDELLSRSFFQPSGNNNHPSYFVMHDLMHNLAQDISDGICFCAEDNLESDQQFQTQINNIRHLSFPRGKFYLFRKLEEFQVLQHLRTFVALPVGLSSLVRDDLMSKFQQLRVLSLGYSMISVLPNFIGELKHLRYLNLNSTNVESLPDSVTNLCNLQTLVLHNCWRLTRLPIDIGNLISLRHLDVDSCPLLENMPQQIGRLKQLQTLSNYIVGKRGFVGIKQLKDLSNLKGKISISRLENVLDIQDARDANLKDKLKIEELSMIWGEKSDGSCGEDIEEQVLCSLQPNINLKDLWIEGYGGGQFSNWISNPSYSKLVLLSLIDCMKCKSLPSVGQLPSLRKLSIRGMDGVESVGVEFEGRVFGHSKPFQCLESLSFEYMREWKEWSWSSRSFSSLCHLKITNCPKLVGKVPIHLTSLVQLNVRGCPEMIVPLPTDLPSLKKYEEYYFDPKFRYGQGGSESSHVTSSSCLELEVSGISTRLYRELKHSLPSVVKLVEIDKTGRLECEWVDGFGVGNLQRLEISGYKQLESLGEEEEEEEQGGLPLMLRCLGIRNCESLRSLPGWIMMRNNNNYTPLRVLKIQWCPSLICFPRGPLTPTLKTLEIRDCKNLASLPEDMGGMCGLEILTIEKCPSLVGFPKGPVSPTLKQLMIIDCENLASLPEDMGSMCGLEILNIVECPSLICFPRGPLAPTLKQLKIRSCKNLTSLPEDMCKCAALEELRLYGCPGVIGFPEGGLPPTLKKLTIAGCEKLGSLPEGILQMQMPMHHHPPYLSSALEELSISGCPSLTCFPSGKFPSTLQTLEISDCVQLHPISNDMFDPYSTNSLVGLTLVEYPNLKTIPDHSLHSLEDLSIAECENLELQPRVFRHLTSLAWLAISDCENIKAPLPEWGLSGLTSLTSLSIQSISPEVSFFFPDHHGHLPPLPATLRSLKISGFQNLESLAPLSLQTLTSLTTLCISNCPKLHSFIPKEGLPDMLSQLDIECCPLLIQRCSREIGEDWPKIAHIPRLWLGDNCL